MLNGSQVNQQALRQLLLTSVPDLIANGEARKDNYIRRLPDISGVELTVGVSQSLLDVRLVLKDAAMALESAATPLMRLLSIGLDGHFVRYPDADRRATLAIQAPAKLDDKQIVDWVRRGVDGLLFVRGHLI